VVQSAPDTLEDATMSRITIASTCLGLWLAWACAGSSTPEGAAPDNDRPARMDTGTGAVASVSEDSPGSEHVQTVEEMLRGRVAGLQVIRTPGGDISLRIRGGDPSLRAEAGEPRDALLVIDGMAVSANNVGDVLRSLRPHQIDNIQVLKDVASTSVYGTRGAHGVVLITTKRE
jgi:TonB-dependent SusC/RagA subfamily outer membrane receptor